ncbi:MAG TPA: type II toxin-antitoxin system VapC family toxin [Candidatus Limnocylindria bacterium]|nr:type II toxin-antitoxin system VapC family toxin [Candidatus Limnocylindria bacterium]
MKLLLDTHVFLWWLTDDRRLSPRAKRAVRDGKNDVFVSAASAWEIAIKTRLGRVTLPEDAERYIADQLERNAFQVLPIRLPHALRVASLPDVHRDPFDRLLVAQALIEDLVILSEDRRLTGYPVRVLW